MIGQKLTRGKLTNKKNPFVLLVAAFFQEKKNGCMARRVLPPFSSLVQDEAPDVGGRLAGNRNFPVPGLIPNRTYADAVFESSLFAPRASNRPTVGQRVDLAVPILGQPLVATRADAPVRGAHGEWQGGQWQNGLFVPDLPVEGYVGWRSDAQTGNYVPPIHLEDRWRIINGIPNGQRSWDYFLPTEWGQTFVHQQRFNRRLHTTNVIFAENRSNRVVRYIIPLFDQELIRFAAFSLLYQLWRAIHTFLSANDSPIRAIPYIRTRNVEPNQEYQTANYPRDIELPGLDLGVAHIQAARQSATWQEFVLNQLPYYEISLNRGDRRNVLWRQVFEWIVQSLIAQVDRSKTSRPNFLLVLSTDLIMVTRMPAGGCSDSAPIDISRGPYQLYRPRNALNSNNCFFHCIGLRGTSEINAERRRMGLKLSEYVPVALIDRCSIGAYIRVIELDAFGEGEVILRREAQGIERKDVITLNLENGHYTRVEFRAERPSSILKCGACGKSYKKTHACNYKRTSYYQSFIRGSGTVVRPMKYLSKQPKADRQFVFFDIETFRMRYNEERAVDLLVPYAVGWRVRAENGMTASVDRVEIGPDCMQKFVSFLKDATDTVVVAYNGSAFDFVILLDEMIRQQVVVSEIGLQDNRIHSCRFGRGNKLFDLYKFTLSSLKSCSEAFGVSHTKGSFPHKFVRSFSDLEFVGPFSELRPFYDDEAEIPAIRSSEVVQLKDLIRHYLMGDIRAMVDVFDAVNIEFHLSEGSDVTDFVTIGSFVYQKWLDQYTDLFPTQPLYCPKNNPYLYNACRSSFYGGRSYGILNSWKHPDLQAIKNRTISYESVAQKSSLSYYDVNSLYAYVMKVNQFPVDKHYVVSEDGAPEFMRVNAGILPLGIYCCNVIPPKNLLHPVLPRRDEDGTLKWDLLEQTRAWHVSAELQLAMDLGYQVRILHGVYWINSEKIFEFFIDDAHRKKQEARRENNKVKAALAKQALVSLFGKQGQLPSVQKTSIISDESELQDFVVNHRLTGMRRLTDETYLAIGEKGDPVEYATRAMHLASFITAYARIFMYEKVIRAGDPSGRSVKNTVFYTDTDCAVMFDMQKRPEFEGLLGEELGQLKNELPEGAIMIELVVIAPKVWGYSVLMPDGGIREFHKCKGVPSEKVDHSLYEKYLEKPDEPFRFQYDLIHPNTLNHAITSDDIELPLFSMVQQRVNVSVNATLNTSRNAHASLTEGSISVSTPFGFESFDTVKN